MRVKSYFSGTVEAALALGRRELGDDALLLNVRPTPAEARALGAYEVVLGVEEEPPAELPPPYREERPLAALRLPAPGEMERSLIDRGLDSWVAAEVAGSREWSSATESDLRRELGGRLRAGSGIGPVPPAIALVGPPGSGKTLTIVKLAIRLGQRYQRPALIVDSDCRRIAAADQLRRLAELAGLAYVHAADPGNVPFLVQDWIGKRPILVDTPGFSPGELDDAGPWRDALGEISALECLLTVMATSHSADLLLAIRRYAFLDPSGLVFTRLDEAASGGGMISAAIQSGLWVRWLATGPLVPEDLAEATVPGICERFFAAGEPPEALAAGSGR